MANKLSKYLVPRTFFVFVEPAKRAQGQEPSRLGDTCQVVVKIHRAAKAPGGQAPPERVLRSWNQVENPAFKTVACAPFPDRVVGANGCGTAAFDGPLQTYPLAGLPPGRPTLVLVTEWLEPDREFWAEAQVHNGRQWGKWERIPHTRLDFIDEDGKVVRDLPLVRPRPCITAQVHEPVIRRGQVTKDGVPLSLEWATIESHVPLATTAGAFLNGRDVTLAFSRVAPANDNRTDDERRRRGKYIYKLSALAAERFCFSQDGCPRLELTAVDVLGNRSQAVALYLPQYSSAGSVEWYSTDTPTFESVRNCFDGKDFDPKEGQSRTFRIRYHNIPFRHMDKILQDKGRNYIECTLNTKIPVKLFQWTAKADSGRRLAQGQMPYLGESAWEDLDKEKKDNTGNVMVKMAEDAWTWVSGPLMLIEAPEPGAGDRENGLQDDSWLVARLGDLFQARIQYEDPSDYEFPEDTGGSSAGTASVPTRTHLDQDEAKGTYTQAGDVSQVLSPQAEAAGIQLTTSAGRPVPAVKNGDHVLLRAFTTLAEPAVRITVAKQTWNEESPIPPNQDPTSSHEKPTVTVELESLKGKDWVQGSVNGQNPLQLVLRNKQSGGAYDLGVRDGEGTIRTSVPTKAAAINTSKQPAPQNPGSAGSDQAPPVLRADYCLEAMQAVRLITQEYLSRHASNQLRPANLPGQLPFTGANSADQAELRRRAGTEMRHEILPGEFLFVSTEPLTVGPAVLGAFRTLEITKRWYVGDQPSVQPAARGTNPRVGGPGTHRVGGLNHKLRDGSVYVHNGEFYQAAEDLHIPGKVMDLTFRRTHLSHSLFTTSLGRNWDWVANMRLVETVNGDVWLMTGDARVERYAARGVPVKPCSAEELGAVLKKGAFNYKEVYAQRQYDSPAGVYRSLVKAEPVEMPGMPAPARGAEPARFYLAGKHGTVWTFVEDVRFHSDVTASADVQAQALEPTPGVVAQYVLVAVHDRRQANYHKFQRNAAGLVEAVQDDFGRITRLTYRPADAVADRFLQSVRDFSGRQIAFALDLRQLEEVRGPVVGPAVDPPAKGQTPAQTKPAPQTRPAAKALPPEEPVFKYRYTSAAGAGPRHRLKTVDDPTDDGVPLLEITAWDVAGRVKGQRVIGQHTYSWDYTSSTVSYREQCCGYDCNGKPADLVNLHTYHVDLPDHGEFAEVVWDVQRVSRHPSLGEDYVLLKTEMHCNRQGEIIKVVLPRLNNHEFQYVVDGSQAGNLLRQWSSGTTRETRVTLYDTHFNLPMTVEANAYRDNGKACPAFTSYEYDEQGNAILVQEPEIDCVTYGYYQEPKRADLKGFEGLLKHQGNLTGPVMVYAYYVPDPNGHVPGDAYDCACMLATTCIVDRDPKDLPWAQFMMADNCQPPADIYIAAWETLKVKGRPEAITNDTQRAKLLAGGSLPQYTFGLITSVKPSLLGDPRFTVDPDGVEDVRQFNNLGLLTQDATGEVYVYRHDMPQQHQVPIPGQAGKMSITEFTHDALGQVLSTALSTMKRRFEYDLDGNTVFETDEAVYERHSLHDERGLLIWTRLSDLKDASLKSIDEYAYDRNGNRTLHEDPCGWHEAWAYDEGDQLVASSDERGLLTTLKYGPGGEVLVAKQLEPAAATAASEMFRTQATTGAVDALAPVKKAVEALAKRLGGGGTPDGELLAQSTYWRDTRGRVTCEERPWTIGGWTRTVDLRAKWDTRDHVLERWTELCLKPQGPKTVHRYDVLGRELNTWLLPLKAGDKAEYDESGKVCIRDLAYGVNGLVRTTANDGAVVVRWKDYRGLPAVTTEEAWTRPAGAVHFEIDRITSTRSGLEAEREQTLRFVLNSTASASATQPSKPPITLTKESLSYDPCLRVEARVIQHRKGCRVAGEPIGSTATDPPVTLTETRHFTPEGRMDLEKTAAGDSDFVRGYQYTGCFGPATVTVGAQQRPVKTAVRYDEMGRELSWQDANGTAFSMFLDGMGAPTLLSAAHGGVPMHRRVLERDPLGRPRQLREQRLGYFVDGRVQAALAAGGEGLLQGLLSGSLVQGGASLAAGTIQALFSSRASVQPVRQFAPAVVNTLAYDTLGNLIEEAQEFAGPGCPAKRTARYEHSATGRRLASTLPDLPNPARDEQRVQTTFNGFDLPDGVSWSSLDSKNSRNLVNNVRYDFRQSWLPTGLTVPAFADSGHPDYDVSYTATWSGYTVRLTSSLGNRPGPLKKAPFGDLVREYNNAPDLVPGKEYVRQDEMTTTARGPKATARRRTVKTYESADYVHDANPNIQGFRSRFALNSWDPSEKDRGPAIKDFRAEFTQRTEDRLGAPRAIAQYEARIPLTPEGDLVPVQNKVSQGFDNSYDLLPDTFARRGLTARPVRCAMADVSLQPRDPSGEADPAGPAVARGLDPSQTDLPFAEPGGIFGRDAFGRPVIVADPEDLGQQYTLLHDALGRIVRKEVPVKVRIPLVQMSEGLVIDLGAPGNTPGHISCAGPEEVVNIIVTTAKLTPGTDFVVRLYGSNVDLDSMLDQLANAQEAWRNADKSSAGKPWVQLFGTVTFESATAFYAPVVLQKGLDRRRIPPYPNATPEKPQEIVRPLGHIVLRRLRVMTGEAVIWDAPDVAFDGCVLEKVRVRGSCPNLRIQNCVFTCTSGRAVQFEKPEPIAAFLTHNLFAPYGLTPVELTLTPGDENIPGTGKHHLVFVNNVVAGPAPAGDVGVFGMVRVVAGYNSPLPAEQAPAFLIQACNYYLKDLKNVEFKGAGSNPDAVAEKLLRQAAVTQYDGLADMPGRIRSQAPVLWDANGILRDPRNPVPGPIEFPRESPPDSQPQRVVHRYLHDGAQPVLRETYRRGLRASGGGWAPGQAPEFTRFIPTFPGGPLLYADADGRVDVDFRDCYGRPWFLYRLREGRHTLYAALPPGQLRPPPGGDPDKDPLTALRGTGLLTGGGWPAWPYLEYAPWYQGALEPDVLMGRRGVLGWDGHDYDPGTIIDWVANVPTLLEKLTDWYDSQEWWGQTLVDVGVIVVVATATILTFGEDLIVLPVVGTTTVGTVAATAAGVGMASSLAYHYAEDVLATDPQAQWAHGLKGVAGFSRQLSGIVLAAPWLAAGVGALGFAGEVAGVLGTGVYAATRADSFREWRFGEHQWYENLEEWGADAAMLGGIAAWSAYRLGRVALTLGRAALASRVGVFLGTEMSNEEFARVAVGRRVLLLGRKQIRVDELARDLRQFGIDAYTVTDERYKLAYMRKIERWAAANPRSRLRMTVRDLANFVSDAQQILRADLIFQNTFNWAGGAGWRRYAMLETIHTSIWRTLRPGLLPPARSASDIGPRGIVRFYRPWPLE